MPSLDDQIHALYERLKSMTPQEMTDKQYEVYFLLSELFAE